MFDVCKRKADTIEDESRAFWRPKNEAFSFYQTSVSEIISGENILGNLDKMKKHVFVDERHIHYYGNKINF